MAGLDRILKEVKEFFSSPKEYFKKIDSNIDLEIIKKYILKEWGNIFDQDTDLGMMYKNLFKKNGIDLPLLDPDEEYGLKELIEEEILRSKNLKEACENILSFYEKCKKRMADKCTNESQTNHEIKEMEEYEYIPKEIIDFVHSPVQKWLEEAEKEHKSVSRFFKKIVFSSASDSDIYEVVKREIVFTEPDYLYKYLDAMLEKAKDPSRKKNESPDKYIKDVVARIGELPLVRFIEEHYGRFSYENDLTLLKSLISKEKGHIFNQNTGTGKIYKELFWDDDIDGKILPLLNLDSIISLSEEINKAILKSNNLDEADKEILNVYKILVRDTIDNYTNGLNTYNAWQIHPKIKEITDVVGENEYLNKAHEMVVNSISDKFDFLKSHLEINEGKITDKRSVVGKIYEDIFWSPGVEGIIFGGFFNDKSKEIIQNMIQDEIKKSTDINEAVLNICNGYRKIISKTIDMFVDEKRSDDLVIALAHLAENTGLLRYMQQKYMPVLDEYVKKGNKKEAADLGAKMKILLLFEETMPEYLQNAKNISQEHKNETPIFGIEIYKEFENGRNKTQ